MLVYWTEKKPSIIEWESIDERGNVSLPAIKIVLFDLFDSWRFHSEYMSVTTLSARMCNILFDREAVNIMYFDTEFRNIYVGLYYTRFFRDTINRANGAYLWSLLLLGIITFSFIRSRVLLSVMVWTHCLSRVNVTRLY